MKFNGSIIITDPCYVIKENEWGDFLDEYWKDEEEQVIEWKGMKFLIADTRYGDWGCTTYNSDTKEEIGSFCADAGLVSVFLLSEVEKYNPDFNYHKERLWTTTLIPDFNGEVEIKYFSKIDEVRVVGTGNINFISAQTSL